MKEFVHLHLHTEYSLLDGASRLNKIFKHCKENNMPAVAMTDHGNMFATIQFYKEAKKEGIKPIFGCEFYMCSDMHQKKGKINGEFEHLVLLAKNDIGYKNLVKLDSLAYVEGFYYKPRIDMALLKKHSEGLICLSACLAGGLPQRLMIGDYSGAKKLALEFVDIFGKDDYYIEIQDHGIPEQKMTNPMLIKLAKEIGVKVVATNDVHYVERSDSEVQDVLLCIQTQRTLDDPNRMRFTGDNFYMKNYDEMLNVFPHMEEALDVTLEIADKCNVQIEFGMDLLPLYTPPDNLSVNEYFRKLVEEGLERRYDVITEEIRQRTEYEFNVITTMNYVDYFLIVWDFINYARERDIPVGPGRGSGVGSIIAYAIGITNVEPLKYNLLFERFLNSERVSMPDFDIDFCNEGRGTVIEYVREKYGSDNVAQIAAFGTMKAKGALKDVARVYKMPYAIVDKLAKGFPNELKMTLPQIFGLGSYLGDKLNTQELMDAYHDDPDVKKVVDMAVRIENMPRQSSMHAAGVVICREKISDYVPLQKNGEDIITQFNKDEVEELGLLKMDFLGLKTLTDIHKAVEYIKEDKGVEIDFDKMGLDDKYVYDYIGTGDTDAVFQLESMGMKKFMRELKPTCFEDIIAGISLYRPGPMSYIPNYIEGKKNPAGIKYLTKELEEILDVTYGVIVYQEQVMQIVQRLAGYSLGQADIIRRAMSKKKSDEMIKHRHIFLHGKDTSDGSGEIEGTLKRGITEKAALEIFDQMDSFAKYAFNKSHAAAYAVVAYQTAYLKKYYPCHLLVAVINNRIHNSDDIVKYLNYANYTGFTVLQPNINESKSQFAVSGNNILFGLSAIKGVGDNFAENIIEVRNEGGAFTSLEDFLRRVDLTLCNKRMVEFLIKGGAFDCVNENRTQLLAVYDPIFQRQSNENKVKAKGQFSFFDDIQDESESVIITAGKTVKEANTYDKLLAEKEALGTYISGHPLNDYKDKINEFGSFNTMQVPRMNEFDDYVQAVKDSGLKHGDKVTCGGIITASNRIITKSGTEMGIFSLEDMFGSIEVVVFPRSYSTLRSKIVDDAIIKFEGSIIINEGEKIKLSANNIEFWDLKEEIVEVEKLSVGVKKEDKAKQNAVAKLYLKIDESRLDDIQNLLLDYDGKDSVFVKINGELLKLPITTRYCKALKAELCDIITENDIHYVSN